MYQLDKLGLSSYLDTLKDEDVAVARRRDRRLVDEAERAARRVPLRVARALPPDGGSCDVRSAQIARALRLSAPTARAGGRCLGPPPALLPPTPRRAT